MRISVALALTFAAGIQALPGFAKERTSSYSCSFGRVDFGNESVIENFTLENVAGAEFQREYAALSLSAGCQIVPASKSSEVPLLTCIIMAKDTWAIASTKPGNNYLKAGIAKVGLDGTYDLTCQF